MAAPSAYFLLPVKPFSPIFIAQFIPLVVGWSMEGHAGEIRLATAVLLLIRADALICINAPIAPCTIRKE